VSEFQAQMPTGPPVDVCVLISPPVLDSADVVRDDPPPFPLLVNSATLWDMTREEVRRWARIGAEARLAALEREIAAIHQVFPDLRSGRSSAPNPYTAGVRAAVEGAVMRRRPRLSLEARKRIAEAQRKRWAELKAKQVSTSTAATTSAIATKAARKKK
jgi:hypothetical protein